jgi:TetR/AcrR family transcriptional regulator, transcriptional repressor for nem operon
MGKGNVTKEFIIEKAAVIFNKNGFAGASMSELMKETGLQKGGIYNHFKSKEEIVLSAFDYAIKKHNYAVYATYKDKKRALDKINAIISFYEDYPLNPIIEGGCPIVNTAVDSDNTNPELKNRVKNVLAGWIKNLVYLIEEGKKNGEFKDQAKAEEISTFVVTTLQGGVVIARSFEDAMYMKNIISELQAYVKRELM